MALSCTRDKRLRADICVMWMPVFDT